MSSAVEEIVRWATPIMTFRRTAARDCELGGQQITAGDKVIMLKGFVAEIPAKVIETRKQTCIIAYEMIGKTHQQAIAYAQLRPG